MSRCRGGHRGRGPLPGEHGFRFFPGLSHTDPGLEPGEREHFADRVWQLMTSCRERRIAEYERVGWWQFGGAAFVVRLQAELAPPLAVGTE